MTNSNKSLFIDRNTSHIKHGWQAKRMIMEYNACVSCALIGHNFPTVVQNFIIIQNYNFGEYLPMSHTIHALIHYQKPNHITQFTTALRDVKEAFRRGQGSTDSPRSDRGSPWSRVPLDTKHNKASLSFRCNLASEQKWQPPCGEAAWEQFGLFERLVSILQNTNFG